MLRNPNSVELKATDGLSGQCLCGTELLKLAHGKIIVCATYTEELGRGSRRPPYKADN